PEWVRLVEQGELTGPRIEAAVRTPVAELRDAGADVLVLGCTHFPFLRDAIQAAAGPGVPLLDTGAPVARWLRHQLQERGLLRSTGMGAMLLETTGNALALAPLASRLLGTPVDAAVTPERWR
ncbi:MAG: glutamate racemase, partial [Achromobacter pestifer]